MSFVLDLNHIKPISLNDLGENINQNKPIVLENQTSIDSVLDTKTILNNNAKAEEQNNLPKTEAPTQENISKKNNTKIKEKISVSKNKQKEKEEEKVEINKVQDLDLLLSIKEVETLSGISKVSIRKAIKLKEINYSLDNGKYRISFKELLTWCYSSTRRKNTFNSAGIGKYVSSWKITIE